MGCSNTALPVSQGGKNGEMDRRLQEKQTQRKAGQRLDAAKQAQERFLAADQRVYVHFQVLEIHTENFVATIVGLDEDGIEILLPRGVKVFYYSLEAARDVGSLLGKLFTGLTRQSCEVLLHTQKPPD